MSDLVTDNRRRGWWWADDSILDEYAAKITPIGLAIYCMLARMADGERQCHPSISTICETLGIARPTAVKYLGKLEVYGLIRIETRELQSGFPDSNLYTLLPVPSNEAGDKNPGGEDLPPSSPRLLVNDVNQALPSSRRELVNDVNQGEAPSPVHDVNCLVNDVNSKEDMQSFVRTNVQTYNPQAHACAREPLAGDEPFRRMAEQVFSENENLIFEYLRTLPTRTQREELIQDFEFHCRQGRREKLTKENLKRAAAGAEEYCRRQEYTRPTVGAFRAELAGIINPLPKPEPGRNSEQRNGTGNPQPPGKSSPVRDAAGPRGGTKRHPHPDDLAAIRQRVDEDFAGRWENRSRRGDGAGDGGGGLESPLEEWTEIGEFETACRDCGALIEPVVFLADPAKRKRYVRRGDHDCPGYDEQRRERAINAHETFLLNPDRGTIARVQADAHLPDRFHAGLHRLRRTEGNEEAIEAAWAMVTRFQAGEQDRGLYLWGAEGRGKSAVSKALAYDLRLRTGNVKPPGWKRPVLQWGPRARVQWWFVPELFSEMFRSWNGQVTEFNEQHVDECDCLVLDDWGKEAPTDFKWRDIFRRVNVRYENGRAMVFTSQYHPGELMARMIAMIGGEYEPDLKALFARIGETCDVVELTGPSWRAR